MPRYLKQYDNYSCGPIAILNALKWAGVKATYKTHYPAIAESCRVKEDEDCGTLSSDLDKTLRLFTNKRFTVTKARECSIQRLEAHLANGGAAVLAHLETKLYVGQTDVEGHFSFWFAVSEDGKSFTGANDGGTGAVIVRPRKEMVEKLRKRKSGVDNYPEAWLLTRIHDE